MFSFIKKWLTPPSTDMNQLLTGGAVIVDVRTKAEYDSGHINGSKNIPLDSINNRLAEIKKYKKPVITVCRSGSRSAMAKAMLQRNGLQAYNGGSWTALKKIMNA